MTATDGRSRNRPVGRIICAAGAAVFMLLGCGSAGAQSRELTPVTDAMLQDPDPADWLNWRRTLDGWGYSPLDQIDRNNVHQLQLVWGWQLGDGLSQAAPLVHDGVMFIPSPRNVVQAVDAVTGDRIWEYRRQFDASTDLLDSVGAGMRTRSIAIYGDKIFVNTSDAHIVALDAATGEVVWRSHRRRLPAGLPLHERADRGERQHRLRHDRLPELQERRLLHLGPRSGHRRAGVAHVDHRASGRAGGRHLGRPAADLPRRRRLVDPGQLRPGDEPDLLVDLAGQAVGPRVAQDGRRRALHEQRAGPSTPPPASWRGTSSSCRARRTTSTTSSRAC